MEHNLLSLDRLIDEAHHRLDYLQYSPNTCKKYRWVWQALLHWSHENGIKAMSSDVVSQFLEYMGVPYGKSTERLTANQRDIRSVVCALNDFAVHGSWPKYQTVKNVKFPAAFEAQVNAFLKYRKVDCCLSQHTLYATEAYLLRFTSFLESSNVKNWTDIQPEHFRAFFDFQTQTQPHSLVKATGIVRKFIKYLWFQKIIPNDLSQYLPHFKARQQRHIPSVWRQEDVVAILEAVDRISALGRRDYAILLLVTRLGLRAGEVRALKLEHIHWEKAQIELFQSKTKNIVLLPLSEEIGQALIDYIRHGRPPATCRELFVRHLAPFDPFAHNNHLHDVITRYRRRAHIPPEEIPKRHGMHSLRFTLATRLLEQGVAMETIAAILGHRSVESTYVYTRVSLETLRSAALDPEEAYHE